MGVTAMRWRVSHAVTPTHRKLCLLSIYRIVCINALLMLR
jgi:hypothetical protein